MRRVGRNRPCPCGSGKKYKNCCWDKGFEWKVDEEGNVHRSISIDHPEYRELFDRAMKEFREQHGREPGPDEPLLRDLGHLEYAEAKIVDVMKRAGVGPQIIYAFEKTGRFVTEHNKDKLTDAELREWDEALDEYDRRVAEGDEPDI